MMMKMRIKKFENFSSYKTDKVKEDLKDTIFYHGTILEDWKSITDDNYLYITGDFEFAKDQAESRAEGMVEYKNNQYTSIVVEITYDQIKNLQWDVDDDAGVYPFKTWEESWNNIGCFVVVGNFDISKFPIIHTKVFTPN